MRLVPHVVLLGAGWIEHRGEGLGWCSLALGRVAIQAILVRCALARRLLFVAGRERVPLTAHLEGVLNVRVIPVWVPLLLTLFVFVDQTERTAVSISVLVGLHDSRRVQFLPQNVFRILRKLREGAFFEVDVLTSRLFLRDRMHVVLTGRLCQKEHSD